MGFIDTLKERAKANVKTLYCQSQKTEEHMRLLHRS